MSIIKGRPWSRSDEDGDRRLYDTPNPRNRIAGAFSPKVFSLEAAKKERAAEVVLVLPPRRRRLTLLKYLRFDWSLVAEEQKRKGNWEMGIEFIGGRRRNRFPFIYMENTAKHTLPQPKKYTYNTIFRYFPN